MTTLTALRIRAVMERTGLSQSQIHRMVQKGQFPAPYSLSERVRAWNAAEVDAWLRGKLGGYN